ncbi:universal stress protein [Pseudooceanicola aestuarii]|uniref:universal stress protein n=1 Tax=Pseudooceanicola aestuarii TaxID=2697319 RepID=UPI0013D0DC9A|nr:universal stress protein [Pseudooceanicola aestuarii]
MQYKTIQTFLTDADTLPDLLARSEQLAERFDAHLDAICLGVDRTQTGYYYAEGSALLVQESLTRAELEAQALERQARKILTSSAARWALPTEVAQMIDLGRHVTAHAGFADLVVLPRPYGDGRGIELEPLLEAALFDGRAPILVLPDSGACAPRPETIVLAWNESPQAMAAARAALPFLRAAKTVHVLVIDPPTHGPGRSDPGGMLANWLARHGARPRVQVQARTLPRISDVILRHAEEVGAGMVVMGAYGHSRFREAILGGATREMLQKAALPVLMAH